jgi:hypothetical protein
MRVTSQCSTVGDRIGLGRLDSLSATVSTTGSRYPGSTQYVQCNLLYPVPVADNRPPPRFNAQLSSPPSQLHEVDFGGGQNPGAA